MAEFVRDPDGEPLVITLVSGTLLPGILWDPSRASISFDGRPLGAKPGAPVVSTGPTFAADDRQKATAVSEPFHVLVKAPTAGAQDFVTRRSQPGVVKWVGFDDEGDLGSKRWPSNLGRIGNPGGLVPELDTTVKASGNSSLKFTIPRDLNGASPGSWYANFSPNLSVQFGENTEFFVQWRQRFDSAMTGTINALRGEGWKHVVIGTGDRPGGAVYASCTALEVVVQSYYDRGFPITYHRCSSIGSRALYEGIGGGSDFKLQNARPSPFCLYTSGYKKPPTYLPPGGGCFGYSADEWMTFQVGLTLGPRIDDWFRKSRVRLWMQRQGQPSEAVVDLITDLYGEGGQPLAKYGKVWLLPYFQGNVPHPQMSTWYDELIISTQKIADAL